MIIGRYCRSVPLKGGMNSSNHVYAKYPSYRYNPLTGFRLVRILLLKKFSPDNDLIEAELSEEYLDTCVDY